MPIHCIGTYNNIALTHRYIVLLFVRKSNKVWRIDSYQASGRVISSHKKFRYFWYTTSPFAYSIDLSDVWLDVFMLPEGRACSRCFICPSVCSKPLLGNLQTKLEKNFICDFLRILHWFTYPGLFNLMLCHGKKGFLVKFEIFTNFIKVGTILRLLVQHEIFSSFFKTVQGVCCWSKAQNHNIFLSYLYFAVL